MLPAIRMVQTIFLIRPMLNVGDRNSFQSSGGPVIERTLAASGNNEDDFELPAGLQESFPANNQNRP